MRPFHPVSAVRAAVTSVVALPGLPGLLGLLGVLGLLGTTLAGPAAAAPAPAPITKAYFGIHASGTASGQFPAASAAAVRLWDIGATWADLQPVARHWKEADFAALDTAVRTTLHNRAQPMLVLGQTPTWASSHRADPSPYGPGAAAMPTSLSSWRSYVTKVVQRYRGRIAVYQIWNEPNVSTFFTGTPGQMALLTREASSIIKRYDRKAYIVSPGFATRRPTNLPWMEQYFEAGAAAYVDAVALHLYPGPAESPETTIALLAKARIVLAREHVDKPIWNTEVNYGAAYGGGAPRHIAGNSAAGYVARTYLLNAANGVARVYWYGWAAHGLLGIDLTTVDNVTPTPAGVAFSTTARWMIGSRVQRCTRDTAGTWTCSLVYGKRSYARAVWNPGRATGYRAQSGATSYETLDGKRVRTRSGRRIQVTNMPVLVRGTLP